MTVDFEILAHVEGGLGRHGFGIPSVIPSQVIPHPVAHVYLEHNPFEPVNGACVKSITSISFFLSKCNVKRKAVLFPIPGKDPNWSTAFSRNFEGIFTFKNTN